MKNLAFSVSVVLSLLGNISSAACECDLDQELEALTPKFERLKRIGVTADSKEHIRLKLKFDTLFKLKKWPPEQGEKLYYELIANMQKPAKKSYDGALKAAAKIKAKAADKDPATCKELSRLDKYISTIFSLHLAGFRKLEATVDKSIESIQP